MTGLDVASSFVQPELLGDDDVAWHEARKLKTAGSICDAYLVTINQRRYFIKRLKPEFRDKPLYISALKKEFEIGSALRHQSIPTYHKAGVNYLVTDYVEGPTLAEMIENRDPWLADSHNVKKLIEQLLDVIGYLHANNVVHCDLKADNIIITSSTRNVVLVDFDKSHTSVDSITSGNPALYGLEIEDTGKRDIDFHALGLLVQLIDSHKPKYGIGRRKFHRFVKTCLRRDIDINSLYTCLRRKNFSFFVVALMVLLAIGAVGAVGIWKWRADVVEAPEANTPDSLNNESLIQTAAFATAAVEESGIIVSEENNRPQSVLKVESSVNQAMQNAPKPQPRSINSKYDEEIRQHFAETASFANQELGNERLADYPVEALEKMIKRLEDHFDSDYHITRMMLLENFPEIKEDEVDVIILNSPVFQKVKGLVEGALAQNRELLEKKKEGL